MYRHRIRIGVLIIGVLILLSLPLWSHSYIRLPSPGETFQDCAECPKMVVVPSGLFTMGSSRDEAHHEDNEEPLHRVNISWIAVGVYEVTLAEWYACVDAGGCGNYIPDDEGWGLRNHPVINVSWEDAQSYVRWLSVRTGKAYRLLSESEWEYVARSGTETAYSWGDSIGVNRANCEGCGSQWDNKQTAPVGSFEANAWGVHDMHGNVWEWVQDCWPRDYSGAPSNGSAWELETCNGRVLRGGSWNSEPGSLRSAYRYWNSADFFSDDYRYRTFGFRVARSLDLQKQRDRPLRFWQHEIDWI